ncbi:MAG TPA: hypothetical protein VNI20_00270 [Fimbriimonadaceae bacterium]|nr:hypothetical protein [Fimbriimonadaceae bacterium]
MVKCVCGKEINSVPDWLNDVKVTFICNNCPSRELQGITQVDLNAGKIEKEPEKEVEEEEEEEEMELEIDELEEEEG